MNEDILLTAAQSDCADLKLPMLFRYDRTLDHITKAIEILDAEDLYCLQVDIWQRLSCFDQPVAMLNDHAVQVSNELLLKGSLEDKIETHERFIKHYNVMDENMYLHVSQYYFDINKPQIAYKTLRKGIDRIENNELIKIFYCQNLSTVNKATKSKVESFLMPIISSKLVSEKIRMVAINQLYLFYFKGEYLNDISLLHRSEYHHQLDMSHPVIGYTATLNRAKNNSELAAVKFCQEQSNLVSATGQLTIPFMYELWQSYKDYFFMVSLSSLEERFTLQLYQDLDPKLMAALRKSVLKRLQCRIGGQDRPFWLLIYFLITPMKQTNRDLHRDFFSYQDLFRSETLDLKYLEYYRYFGKRNEAKDNLLPLMLRLWTKSSSDSGSRIKRDMLFKIMSPEGIFCAIQNTRPLPYFGVELLDSLKTLDVSFEFEDDLFRSLIWPLRFYDAIKHPNVVQLIDYLEENYSIDWENGVLRHHELENNKFEQIASLYEPKYDQVIDTHSLDMRKLAALGAYLYAFTNKDTEICVPICSGDVSWFPTIQSSINYGSALINSGEAYLSNANLGEGIEIKENKIIACWGKCQIALNFEAGIGIFLQKHLIDTYLARRIKKFGVEEFHRQLRTIFIEDLIEYALERFEAYRIPVHDKAKIGETAAHCLESFSLEQCYGLFYRLIEDAAAKQIEKSMSNTYTVNYALSAIKGRANRALSEGWKLSSYTRSQNASPACAVIQYVDYIVNKLTNDAPTKAHDMDIPK